MEEVWITGAGVISALGVGKEATLQALLEERAGIGPVRFLDTTQTEFPVGEVPLDNEELRLLAGVGKKPISRSALMGIVAMKEALEEAGIGRDEMGKVSVVSGTTVGGMDIGEKYYRDWLGNDDYNDYIKTYTCGACTEQIVEATGPVRMATTLSTACSSAANAVILGANMIKTGEADCVVVGGTECLTRLHLNGFGSLMILDKGLCRPFDAGRGGLNLGEGAAYLVLESATHARQRGVSAKALLAGYGNACDASHQTATSENGEGPYRAMKKALEMAGIEPSQVDYINAHGTGTENNDATESAALLRLFGEDCRVPVSSTKSFTGHTTSASGSIESVISLLAMEHGFVPANLRCDTPGEGCVKPVCHTMRDVRLHYVLSNSFAFGGNDTALLFAAPEVKVAMPAMPDSRQLYICAAEQVSLQQPLCRDWMTSPKMHNTPLEKAEDPSFGEYLKPLEARRMGLMLRRAAVTAGKATADCVPDAIVAGTGLGSIEYTEQILDSLYDDGEGYVRPACFMQSTHNTAASTIAIRTVNHGYNATYSHNGSSFAASLYDIWLQQRLGYLSTALVTAQDEMTEGFFRIFAKHGFLGNQGVTAGECSAAFLLSDRGENLSRAMCKLSGVEMQHCPTDEEKHLALLRLLAKAGLSLDKVAGVLLGLNGRETHDARLLASARKVYGEVPLLQYKHLFGEGFSAEALGVYAAACCLSAGEVARPLNIDDSAPKIVGPECLLVEGGDEDGVQSLILLTRK